MKLAIKIIDKDRLEFNDVEKDLLMNELKVLTDIPHPYIVRVFELLHDPYSYYIVSELVKHGDLDNYVK